MWLSAAAGRQCRNLDFFMMGRNGWRRSSSNGSEGAEVSLVECNHGLHDGLDLEGGDSSAALARLLEAPVLLVVNAEKMNRGVAPLVMGQVGFDPEVPVAGIVLNLRQRTAARREDQGGPDAVLRPAGPGSAAPPARSRR